MSRLYISAAHKSSGKTTVSIGLCAAWREAGKTVQAFKKGPDYIDPHWLGRASGRACYNLDFYTMQRNEILRCLTQHSRGAGLTLIEGNKGLYDGLDLDGSNSNAALASLTATPVILVLDARGMTRGIAPLILGYQAFDRNIHIAGVILNQLGGSRHEAKLRSVIEHYTDVKVVGAIHRNPDFGIDERHLGLVPSHEDPYADRKIAMLADSVRQQVNLQQLFDLGKQADALHDDPIPPDISSPPEADVRVGIVKCGAFGFYYPDDLQAFRQQGAQLIDIDVTTETALPELDALFIGGGFPETHLPLLQANTAMRHAIKQVIDAGMPVYAECGGLMYLARSITWQQQHGEMVGAIDADIIMEPRPQGRGYVRLQSSDCHPWLPAGVDISAHEFHYSRFRQTPENADFAFRVERGTGIDGAHDGYRYKNLLACYAHQRHTDANPWVKHFVQFIRQHKQT